VTVVAAHQLAQLHCPLASATDRVAKGPPGTKKSGVDRRGARRRRSASGGVCRGPRREPSDSKRTAHTAQATGEGETKARRSSRSTGSVSRGQEVNHRARPRRGTLHHVGGAGCRDELRFRRAVINFPLLIQSSTGLLAVLFVWHRDEAKRAPLSIARRKLRI
jgi:hypothetical protein